MNLEDNTDIKPADNIKKPGAIKRFLKQRRVRNTAGIITSIIQICLSCIALFLLWRSHFIPSGLLILVALILTALIILFRVLMNTGEYKARFYIGWIPSVVCCIVLIYISVFLTSVTGTFQDITDSETETSIMGIYVLEGPEQQELSETSVTEFEVIGILSNLDRESTDGVIAQIEESLGDEVRFIEYPDSAELVDALLSGECDAIILNSGFMKMLGDVDEYSELDTLVHQVTTYELTSLVHDSERSVPTAEEVVSLGTFTVYISGTDTFGPVDAKGNSDTNILAAVNIDTRQILLISTPRDYYVELSISEGEKDKLTHAGIFGIQVSMDTLAMLYDVDIDYYFRVNFTGFEEIIDALGGIDVMSDYAFVVEPIFYYEEGLNHLSGIEALAFARERYSFPEGDRQRGKNQMEVIKGVINAVQDPVILREFSTLSEALKNCVDTDIPYDLLTGLVRGQLENNTPWNVVMYSVNGTDGRETCYSLNRSLYVMIPEESTVEYAKELIREVVAGQTVIPEE